VDEGEGQMHMLLTVCAAIAVDGVWQILSPGSCQSFAAAAAEHQIFICIQS
jgi:hypothetical protein